MKRHIRSSQSQRASRDSADFILASDVCPFFLFLIILTYLLANLTPFFFIKVAALPYEEYYEALVTTFELLSDERTTILLAYQVSSQQI